MFADSFVPKSFKKLLGDWAGGLVKRVFGVAFGLADKLLTFLTCLDRGQECVIDLSRPGYVGQLYRYNRYAAFYFVEFFLEQFFNVFRDSILAGNCLVNGIVDHCSYDRTSNEALQQWCYTFSYNISITLARLYIIGINIFEEPLRVINLIGQYPPGMDKMIIAAGRTTAGVALFFTSCNAIALDYGIEFFRYASSVFRTCGEQF